MPAGDSEQRGATGASRRTSVGLASGLELRIRGWSTAVDLETERRLDLRGRSVGGFISRAEMLMRDLVFGITSAGAGTPTDFLREDERLKTLGSGSARLFLDLLAEVDSVISRRVGPL